MEPLKWKNKGNARHFEVPDPLFEAVYAEGDQVLKDCMDIATATGMRLTDVRNITMPAGDMLTRKTGKAADYDISVSSVLPELIGLRRKLKANQLMLLSTPTGRPVSEALLRHRWDAARAAAAAKPEEAGDQALAVAIRAMCLRDMRKRAADLAEYMEEASKLLQHSSTKVTARHYRTRTTKLKPVR